MNDGPSEEATATEEVAVLQNSLTGEVVSLHERANRVPVTSFSMSDRSTGIPALCVRTLADLLTQAHREQGRDGMPNEERIRTAAQLVIAFGVKDPLDSHRFALGSGSVMRLLDVYPESVERDAEVMTECRWLLGVA